MTKKPKSDSLLDTPNELLDQLIEARGLNHARICRRLEIHYHTWISNRKNPAIMPLGRFVKLARMLDVNLDDLWKVMRTGRQMEEEDMQEDNL
jgi:hypothetical protein